MRIKSWQLTSPPAKLLFLRFGATVYRPIQCQANSRMNEPWISVEQIAEHLGVTRDSIYRWIDAKGLPAHKIGRLWKFKITEVDDWVRRDGARDADARKPDGN
jgi:excisionase family DNA binding protein